MKTKYSIVIADDEYNKINFLTQRPWELIINNVIPFKDVNYDTNNHCYLPDFLTVNDSTELNDKIIFLDKNKKNYNNMVEYLNNLYHIEKKYINSRECENKLINLLK